MTRDHVNAATVLFAPLLASWVFAVLFGTAAGYTHVAPSWQLPTPRIDRLDLRTWPNVIDVRFRVA